MTGVVIDQKSFEALIEQYYPEVYRHMLKNSFQPETFTTQWFVCLFANTIKMDRDNENPCILSLLDVWDYFFTLGI